MKKRQQYQSKKNIKKKVYFFSDAHLGFGNDEEERQKELRLIKFLDYIKRDAEQVYIVGDLFDYWFEYKTVVPKKFFRIFTKIAELSDNGTRIFFIAGNHDFWVNDYFHKELGMEVHLDPIEREIYGKRFLIHHGDGLLKNDFGYKTLKRVLRNRLNIFLFSLIHPDITGKIARWSSRTSRKYSSNRKYEGDGMIEFAISKLKEGFDFVVMGHNHKSCLEKIDNGTYINLGDWIFENTYAVFDGTKIELKKWSK